uniref:HMA domain-containing protein n=1 Tax=Salix viminalis TaxID=40686 RepID=A0A6N2MW42_SALVM
MPPIDSSFLLSTLSPSHTIRSWFLDPFPNGSRKPRVTEIQVRMDCNGCVQKIKKALHGINGIYDIYIDFPQQKLTVIGWADPEKIIKAIRKTRKIATICSHTEQSDPAAQTTEKPPEQAPEGGAPPPPASEQANPPASEAPPAETAASPAEPPKDPPQPENPPPPGGNPLPSPVAEETSARQPEKPPGPKDVGEVHVLYTITHLTLATDMLMVITMAYPVSQAVPQAAPKPVYVTHSYNTYRPPPNVTEYEYLRPPSHHSTIYSRMDHYDEDYHDNSRSSNGNITSMFSDENPNACRIM